MKNLYLIILLSLPLISYDFLAQSNGKSFLSLGYTHQNIESYENGKALNLNYSFIHQDYWGVDAGYIQSLDDTEHISTKEKKDFSTATVFLTYLFPLTPTTGIKSKIGYAKTKHTDDTITYGAELIFQVSKNMGLSIAYQQINSDIDYLMINSIYRLRNKF